MLSTAIKILEQDVFNAIRDDSVAECLETALMSTFPSDSKGSEQSKKIAESFGKIAARYLAGALTKPLCTAIDKYVHDIGIQITIPPTVISPTGSCSGIINPTDVKVL